MMYVCVISVCVCVCVCVSLSHTDKKSALVAPGVNKDSGHFNSFTLQTQVGRVYWFHSHSRGTSRRSTVCRNVGFKPEQQLEEQLGL